MNAPRSAALAALALLAGACGRELGGPSSGRSVATLPDGAWVVAGRFEGELRLIHDLPGGRWSWGADASLAHHEREFRLDEARVEGMGTAFGAYVEFRPRADWRFRLEADNIGSASLTDTRRKFAGSRASGIIDSIERRRLRTSPILSLSARKSFGGAGD